MRLLLLLLIAFLTLSVAFDFDPGPAPGLKIKNALLYALILALLLKSTMDRNFRIQLPVIPALFAVLIGYALLTYLAIILVLDYPHYGALENAFYLKNALVDRMLFFLVFFYGVSTNKDASLLLKSLLLAWALSHLMAVADAWGFVTIGDLEQREDGRVQGTIGESNQYGAFAALSLPAIVSGAFIVRGVRRLWWVLAALMTAGALLMTVSRGAYVAIAIAAISGFLLFRRYASPRQLMMFTGATIVSVIALVVGIAALGFGDLLLERLIAGAKNADLGATSSGRTEIWAKAIGVMFEHPLTLFTGFGWNAYNSMPFRYAPHNYYLWNWFNLGLPGLLCSVLLLYLPIRTARAAIAVASADVRPLLMGFVIGSIALASATFFVDLYMPWLFYWAYAGVAMRLAVNAQEQSATNAARATATEDVRADNFGWQGATWRRI